MGKFQNTLPEEVVKIGEKLTKSSYSAHLVGGCVRDLLLGRETTDWDIATSALPEEIVKIFPDSFYNNTFGTVGVKLDSGIVEITTYRKESNYSDARHPDKVIFTEKVEDDLGRRDFTVNALAIDMKNIIEKQHTLFLKGIKNSKDIISFEESLSSGKENRGPGIEGSQKNLLTVEEVPKLGFGEYPKFQLPKTDLSLVDRSYLIDKFAGLEDLEKGLLRAVGDPEKRFQEDALRLMRAVRFSVQLGFKIEKKTAIAIKRNAKLLQKISRERIRDEFSKILLSDWPAEGIVLLRKLGLLKEIIPVLEEGRGVQQDWHHVYTVYKHSVLSLKFCFSDSLELRLAALLHDTAKPKVKRIGKMGKATFYFHEVEGSKIAQKNLLNLRYPTKTIENVAHLVRYHMFNYDPALHNESTVRRMLHRVGGIEKMKELLIIRIADRLGSGCKQGEVFKLRKLKYLIEKVSKDPISLKQLKVGGKDIMEHLKIKPGPYLGGILDILLTTTITEPKNNNKKKLLDLAEGLWLAEKANPGFLEVERKKAEEFLDSRRQADDYVLQDKYRVREKRI